MPEKTGYTFWGDQGIDLKNIIPNADTPIMLIATQIPVPKKNNKILIKNTVKNISVIF